MNILAEALCLLAGQAVDSAAQTTQHCGGASGMVPSYALASGIVFWLFIAWMLGVIAYYWWAIRHYNLNWGLSPQEWKILQPETYGKNQNEINDFLQRRAALLKRTGGVLAEPRGNPYEKDSFGLPPGTVRGTLALTALVGFVLVQSLSMVSPSSMDSHFEQLNTIFKMVMAFYFGSRALEMLEKGRRGECPPIVGNTDPAVDAAGVAKAPSTAGAPKPEPDSTEDPKAPLPEEVVEDVSKMPPPPQKDPAKPA